MTIVKNVFVERTYSYDPLELLRWRADATFVHELLRVTGSMHCGTQLVIPNQAKDGQWYSEVKYASHLIERNGHRREDVCLEQRMCLAPTAMKPRAAGRRFHERTRQIFSPAFLHGFERLCELNDRPPSSMFVDLAALDGRDGICTFVEIKTFRTERRKHEPIAPHQLQFLAFVRHLAGTLGGNAFVDRRPRPVEAELVVFVPREQAWIPTAHPVEFVADH